MAWTEEQQKQVYGETIAEMEQAFRMANTGEYSSERTMYAMSILSDAQHVLEEFTHGDAKETVRQFINKAKYFIGEVHHELRKQGQ